jgi:hypothetical protein
MSGQVGHEKVRTEENIETVQRQMKDESQLSLRQLSDLFLVIR